MDKDKNSEKFRPEEKDIGIIKDITDRNTEGLQKLAKEHQSKKLRETNKYVRKLHKIYRKYIKRSEAQTQTIKA